MISFIRRLRMAIELNRSLRARRVIREARAQAARKGHSTYWRRVGENTRRLFGA